MRRRRSSSGCAGLILVAALAGGCGAVRARPVPTTRADFFPLTPRSRWEYVVERRGGAERFRFVATVRSADFVGPDGRNCRVVDERYTDVGADEAFPIVYCVEGGFLHRVMSLEYRGDTLEDNGLRSGELKFLPTNLKRASSWEGFTNAYRLPDGSGFGVQQYHRAIPSPEDVIVPAGTFSDCVRVETTAVHYATDPHGQPVGPTVTFYYLDWYAPGIGLVRTEQRNADAAVLATIELAHYDIGDEVEAAIR